MSQRNTITLVNAASASLAFNPLSTAGQGEWIEYFDNSGGGISAGRNILRIRSKLVSPTDSLRMSGPGRNVLMNKVEIQVITPVLEAVSAASTGYDAVPSPAYHLTFKAEFLLPDRSTEANRDNLLALARSLLGDAVMTAAISDLNVPF